MNKNIDKSFFERSKPKNPFINPRVEANPAFVMGKPSSQNEEKKAPVELEFFKASKEELKVLPKLTGPVELEFSEFAEENQNMAGN
jgi:hypothetical protein